MIDVYIFILFYKLINKIDHRIWLILKNYYDSSKGKIDINGDVRYFTINCGVKQGGILSPFLFNLYINDLIEECINMNIGALIGNVNTSIIVYADDIILISPNDLHLQTLLDSCSVYGSRWLIKFNPKKSNILSFGSSMFDKRYFSLNNSILNEVNEIEYLGFIINSKLDSNEIACKKFRNIQKSIFSLSFLGLKPNSINPKLQAFIYKTYCLSTFTYGLENMTLNAMSKDFLNVSQNKCLRQIVGLKKFCRMSNILKCLKIFNFEQLYIYYKLNFINTISNNDISSNIFSYLINNRGHNQKSNSIKKDFCIIENFFNSKIDIISKNCKTYKIILKKQLSIKNNGICNTILYCLNNIKIKFFKNFLNLITRVDFYNNNSYT